ISASGAQAQCSFAIHYRVAGTPSLACASAITQACTGPRTTIALPAPMAIETCDGNMLPAPVNDAPAEGFAVGDTTVTFHAPDASCTLPVTITDPAPPHIDCGMPQTIVRTDPATPITVAP